MTNVALIPARGGSKRIPGKNLALLAGRSLLSWSIEAAKRAVEVDRVVVSTDCERIAEEARRCGAEAPFMRPAALASDHASSVDVILHAIEQLESESGDIERLILLQPTSPLRDADDIDGAIRLAVTTGAESVVSVGPAPVHPRFMYRRLDSGHLSAVCPEYEMTGRSQDLPPVCFLNGAVYVLTPGFVRTRRTTFSPDTLAYCMSSENSIDIDEPSDLAFADFLMRQRLRSAE